MWLGNQEETVSWKQERREGSEMLAVSRAVGKLRGVKAKTQPLSWL